MNSLFLRIYLSALAFSVVTFFTVLFMANNLFFKDLLGDSSQQLYQSISQSLATKDKSTWQSEVKIYNSLVTDFTLSLITVDAISNKEKQDLLDAKSGQILSDNTIGRVDLYALYTLADSKWILKIDEDDDRGNDTANTLDAILFFLLLMLPLAFALYFLVRKLTKPIQHLTTVAKKLGQGDLSVRADHHLPPPMNTLATGFNTMADQLDETLQEQQVLIGAIPHELRSPLAKIRFALDMTRKQNNVEALRENIENMDAYVDEMQQAIDEILELNRLQDHSKNERSNFKLCSLIGLLTESLTTESSNISFTIDCDEVTTTANGVLIKRALQNVLSNAQRHAKSAIHIKAWQEASETIIQIDDDGKGIPSKKYNEVFMPFATLDSSRNRKTGGIGLGLSIVKMIMKKHHGKISASQSELGGARFELRWNRCIKNEH